MFDGYQIYHNFVRSHMGLDGKTPAEKCGLMLREIINGILSSKTHQVKMSSVRRRCEKCRNMWKGDTPCPNCGHVESVILGVVNETVSIREIITRIIRKRFTKKNYYAISIFVGLIVLQAYWVFSLEQKSELIIGIFFAFITFIAGFYAFIHIHQMDRETQR